MRKLFKSSEKISALKVEMLHAINYKLYSTSLCLIADLGQSKLFWKTIFVSTLVRIWYMIRSQRLEICVCGENFFNLSLYFYTLMLYQNWFCTPITFNNPINTGFSIVSVVLNYFHTCLNWNQSFTKKVFNRKLKVICIENVYFWWFFCLGWRKINHIMEDKMTTL